jgi:hypothetical protein
LQQDLLLLACVAHPESALLAVSRSDMSVQVMDPITGRLFADIPKKVGQKEKVSGLSILWEGISLAARDCAVLSCTGDGLVRMHSPKDEMFRSMAGEPSETHATA